MRRTICPSCRSIMWRVRSSKPGSSFASLRSCKPLRSGASGLRSSWASVARNSSLRRSIALSALLLSFRTSLSCCKRLRALARLALAFAKRELRGAPVVHVAQDGRDEGARAVLPAGGRDLEVAQRAVLEPHADLDGAGQTRCPRSTLARSSGQALSVSNSSAVLWPDQLVGRIAELPRGSGVGEPDDSRRCRR